MAQQPTPSGPALIQTGDATAIIPSGRDDLSPVTVIANDAIRATLEPDALRQALNTRWCPGVTRVVLNPDAHVGFGAPIGCVLASPSHIYPGPVGVDIKCSMSLLQLDLEKDAVDDKRTRRALIDAICARIPTGVGSRVAPAARPISSDVGRRAIIEGASRGVCESLGIPAHWAERCEDSHHVGHDGTVDALAKRFEIVVEPTLRQWFASKAVQLGSYGGGNHFGECELVEIGQSERARTAAAAFGLRDGTVAFMSHCGSRGWGATLANAQFKIMAGHFEANDIAFPAGDRHLVYAELGTPLADNYLDDMAMGANFATVNHMLINALVLEAFQEVIPGTTGELVYFISHNIARLEDVDGVTQWVHRKGATRAFPAGHPALASTPFAHTGHPILLPGNPQAGSVVMAAEAGAAMACYSVNHGAGRCMSRSRANKTLNQHSVNQHLANADVLFNGRNYPLDEAPAAYKDFEQVVGSVKQAGLASEVARLRACFVIKDNDKPDD